MSDDGLTYTHDRGGNLICAGYNSGTCVEVVSNNAVCNAHGGRHICSRCLTHHPITACPHEYMPVPNNIQRFISKGGGKGGYEGKGGKAGGKAGGKTKGKGAGKSQWGKGKGGWWGW